MNGEDMKRIRRDAGLTVREMAMMLNFDDPDRNGSDRVREYERGKRAPTGPVIRLLQLIERGDYHFAMLDNSG